ncbi:MAG TPA: SUMF1/EgtB/PvdO family nonheme iron enzyme [Gemmataceae bacterium]|nr:SUMF1/EgtB/PvdO family nonheme iron enzyme [Gemmataceae bacterium]
MSELLQVEIGSTLLPARHVDQVCDGFEAAWKASGRAGARPRIEDYLAAVAQPERAALCRELIKLDIEYRRRLGEEAVVEDYARFLAPEPAAPGGADEIPVPLRLGRYRIAARLGTGGFGVVYRGYDEELRREVAIKVRHPDRTASADSTLLYLAEARMLASLDHPGIVPVYDFGRTEDGTCYFVSKLVTGIDLGKRLRQSRFAAAAAAEVITRVAEALHHAHQRGLVHRDIKPANILLDTEGSPFVADFGMALREEDFGQGPSFAGTPVYMSPEQARGEGHRVDGRTDIYSLGAIFYELLTGQRLVQADDLDGVLEQIKTWEPRPPRQLDSAIPKELDRICLKTLSKRASDRYSTALDLAEDLRHWLAGQRDPAQVPTPPLSLLPPAAAQKGREGGTTASLPVPRRGEAADSDAAPIKIVPKGLRAFDVEDADFFLQLLPGPRDRDGLPDNIRFWKTRLEETDADRAFSVGLLYGPSGCGKSSFVKAGLLPRLAAHVLPIYVEAAPRDTETRLLAALRKRCPQVPPALPLPEALARLRRERALAPAKKVVLVLDQFEQYLHAADQDRNGLLVPALRQCDGQHVQCVLMVRDDFWMAATRFMRELEVRLVENQNSLAVDLFDPRHARKVLTEFGRSFGALPDNPGELSREQVRFLDQAVAGLARDGKVIPVQLALFAEMIKARPWTPAVFKQLGGMEGIAVTFLEETFSARTAPPEHRFHQKAARAVLGALLPQEGTDLKAHMTAHRTLLEASGYAARPREFEELLRILDTELRLVTPTDPEGVGEWQTSGAATPNNGAPAEPTQGPAGRGTNASGLAGYYQLTHDHMVPALRQWLTRKQRETRRGRMQLRLAERAALWSARPENRHLPGWWESLNILLFTREREWSASQRRMLRAGSRLHLIQLGVLAILLVLAGAALWQWVFAAQWAGHLVQAVVSADVSHLPQIVKDLSPYRRWADPLLKKKLEQYRKDSKTQGEEYSRQELNVTLALLPVDSEQVAYLRRWLLAVNNPDDLQSICEGLAEKHSQELVDWLWSLLKTEADSKRRLRAALALAYYDPANEAWELGLSDEVANQLIAEQAKQIEKWLPLLNGIRFDLRTSLAKIFRDPSRRELDRDLATHMFILVGAADIKAESLRDYVLEAEGRQSLLEYFLADRRSAEPLLNQELDTVTRPNASEQEKDSRAQRQAHTATALLQLAQKWEGETENPVLVQRIWPLLRHSADPRLRAYLIHRLGPAEVNPDMLIRRYGEETDVSARQALLLSLGEFPEKTLPAEKRDAFAPSLLQIYADEADPGLHSAVAWLLRRWGKEKSLGQADHKLTGLPAGPRGWYVTKRHEHTLAVLGEPGEFAMGSPVQETDRRPDEKLHAAHIGRPFALATREVTVRQFREFLQAHPGIGHDAIVTQKYSPEPDGPMLPLTWYQAAQYCRWLSEQEGITEKEMCYPPVDQIKDGMTLPADCLVRTGYRLPTEAEWEYACRAGTGTSRFYGVAGTMLGQYAWYAGNSEDRAQPVARLKPNDFGLFDMYGNAWEWCQDAFLTDSSGLDMPGRVEQQSTITDAQSRVLRGGCFASPATVARSAYRFGLQPKASFSFAGLRVARTMPRRP